MIRDRIVARIRDIKVKDRLLRESDFNLEKTIHICKAAELAVSQVKKMDGSLESDINTVQRKTGTNKKKAPKGTEQAKQKQQQVVTERDGRYSASGTKGNCKFCGYTHVYGKCPAYGKTRNSCHVHFSKVCHRKGNKSKEVSFVDTYDNEYSELFVELIHVDMINAKKDWLQTVEFVDYNNFPWSRFKIDTCAQCNIISTDMCRNLGITDIKNNLR